MTMTFDTFPLARAFPWVQRTPANGVRATATLRSADSPKYATRERDDHGRGPSAGLPPRGEPTLASLVEPHRLALTGTRYALHQAIARGGMSMVYLGSMQRHNAPSLPVALKRLRPDKPQSCRYALVREALLIARIRHPNVVGIFDLLHMEREWLLVMPFVEGVSLARLIAKAGSPPVAVSVAIVVDALRGLHAAHSAKGSTGRDLQLVHRDVTPQNILVGRGGSATLIDFGIAKCGPRPERASDYLQGKPGYFAPEQTLGHGVDARTDIFATGVVLWEVLAGRRLFPGSAGTSRLSSLALERLPGPSCFNRRVCPRLDGLVLDALCRWPDKRYASAALFADALEASVPVATRREVSRYLQAAMCDELSDQRRLLARARHGQLPAFTLTPVTQ